MRAAIFNGAGRPITTEILPDPTPGPGEVLIEVGRCGICGSDVSMTGGTPFDYATGKCFGHEYSGTVVDLAPDVEGLATGDQVACMPMSGCGQCDPCREGHLLFCQNGVGTGRGFAQYVALPANAATLLPQSLSLADGALVEPMACGLHALTSAGMRGGERVLVLGAGSMALSATWWARRLKAGRIVVASRSAHRRDICLAFGADEVHAFENEEPGALERALGGPAHIVVECVGKEGLLGTALQYLRLGGTVISMGMCTRPETIVPAGLTFREARLVFPLRYSADEYVRTARELEAAGLQPEMMVSDVLPLESLGDAIENLRAGARTLKVHIDPRMKP